MKTTVFDEMFGWGITPRDVEWCNLSLWFYGDDEKHEFILAPGHDEVDTADFVEQCKATAYEVSDDGYGLGFAGAMGSVMLKDGTWLGTWMNTFRRFQRPSFDGKLIESEITDNIRKAYKPGFMSGFRTPNEYKAQYENQ